MTVTPDLTTASPATREWYALSKDIRTAAEELAGPLRPMTHIETLLAIGMAIAGERKRSAAVARAYLEDIAGCDMNEDEPEQIERAILSGEASKGGEG